MADEVDKIGDDSFKAVNVAVTHVVMPPSLLPSRARTAPRRLSALTERAAEELGKGVAKGSEDVAKGTVYVTEEAGRKVVPFVRTGHLRTYWVTGGATQRRVFDIAAKARISDI